MNPIKTILIAMTLFTAIAVPSAAQAEGSCPLFSNAAFAPYFAQHQSLPALKTLWEPHPHQSDRMILRQFFHQLTGVDKATFAPYLLNHAFKDDRNCEIKGVSDFNSIPTGYARDSHSLYYLDERVGVASSAFVSPAVRWGVDENGVYLEGRLVIGKDQFCTLIRGTCSGKLDAATIAETAKSIAQQVQTAQHQVVSILGHVLWVQRPQSGTLHDVYRSTINPGNMPPVNASPSVQRITFKTQANRVFKTGGYAPAPDEHFFVAGYRGEHLFYQGQLVFSDPKGQALRVRMLKDPISQDEVGFATQSHAYWLADSNPRDRKSGWRNPYVQIPIDAASFEMLGHGYARDKSSVWFAPRWDSNRQAVWSVDSALIDDGHCACSATDSQAVCHQRLPPERQAAMAELAALNAELITVDGQRTELQKKRAALIAKIGFATPVLDGNGRLLPQLVRGEMMLLPAARGFVPQHSPPPGLADYTGLACTVKNYGHRDSAGRHPNELAVTDFRLRLIDGLPVGYFATLDNWVWIDGTARMVKGGVAGLKRSQGKDAHLEDGFYAYSAGGSYPLAQREVLAK